MNAGWSGAEEVVVDDEGQDEDVGGMYVDSLIWEPVHGKQEILFSKDTTLLWGSMYLSCSSRCSVCSSRHSSHVVCYSSWKTFCETTLLDLYSRSLGIAIGRQINT